MTTPTATPETDAPLVHAVNVTKAFHHTEVLKGIDMDVRRGEVVVLLGPSGSGKTTFLRCINQLETIQGGRIWVDGELAGPGRYALRVRGDSLVELGIFDGDLAIVDPEQPARHGDLVAALLPSEHGDEDLATLKVFELRQGQAWLVAANPVYAPIPIEQTWVLGRVTTTIRRF